MVANISTKNGKAEAVTSMSPAWWDRDGEYCVDHHMTSDEVWGDRGVLNFDYALRPVFDESGSPIKGYLRTVRTDTGATVGCGLTNRYKLVQPRKAFEWIDSLMNDGVMKYASAGVLRGGKEIWILGVIPDADGASINGERHQKHVLWTDRYDGGGSLKWFPCATRVECSNTLSLALGERDRKLFQGIRHSGDMDTKLEAARSAIIDAKQAFQQYNADCRKLIAATYTKGEAKHFVERLFPSLHDAASQRSKSIRERKVQAVRDAFADETNNLGEMPGTWYQLANAVTFAVDHSNVFAFRGDDTRFTSLMTGDGAKLKRDAFDLALSMAN